MGSGRRVVFMGALGRWVKCRGRVATNRGLMETSWRARTAETATAIVVAGGSMLQRSTRRWNSCASLVVWIVTQAPCQCTSAATDTSTCLHRFARTASCRLWWPPLDLRLNTLVLLWYSVSEMRRCFGAGTWTAGESFMMQ